MNLAEVAAGPLQMSRIAQNVNQGVGSVQLMSSLGKLFLQFLYHLLPGLVCGRLRACSSREDCLESRGG